MRKLALFLSVVLFGLTYAQKVPDVLKTKFSDEALAQKVIAENGDSITVKEIFDKYKGKIFILDFWAGWCPDCINALPKTKELEKNNPDVSFIFFSLERSKEGFHKSIEKYGMKGKENYWFETGWKNNFNNYIDLNWIPRYMIIDQKGNIAKYYAIIPEDPDIQATIDILTKNIE